MPLNYEQLKPIIVAYHDNDKINEDDSNASKINGI